MTDISMRVGQGYDVHKFAEPAGEGEQCQLVLGGVTIPYDRSLVAHSDGDVVIHALCDAILGSLAYGDIGKHFPDSDPQYAGCDSALLLTRVMELVGRENWVLVNADITVVAQAPKLAPHIDSMRNRLASIVGASVSSISIKATTTEGLGFEGRGEGIASFATVLMRQSDL